MCGIPLNPSPEISIEAWKRILDDIAGWTRGSSKVQYSGGEPLLFKGFMEVLKYSVELGLLPGFCTNATLMKEDDAARFMEMGLENINVSLDGVEEIGDRIRGAGSFARTDEGIRRLVRARTKTGSTTPIILKTCLMGVNAPGIERLLAYARSSGVDAILFQPMEIREFDSDSNAGLLDCDGAVIQKAIDLIIESRMKEKIVLNSLANLKLFEAYFNRRGAAGPGLQRCTVGDGSLMIDSQGDMSFCIDLGGIGNATEVPPSVAWRSKEAKKSRQRIYRCKRGCLQTCYANRTLIDKVRSFAFLVRRPTTRAD
jgi:MoaA/NifB/PqqE/SkfB family radical SAM enzyme